MTDSILDSIKELLGIDLEITEFDTDIIININSALFSLTQLGVGPTKGFNVLSKQETYADFIGAGCVYRGGVQQYIYYRTKLGFDPPTNATVISAMTDSIHELEWRLKIQVENPALGSA